VEGPLGLRRDTHCFRLGCQASVNWTAEVWSEELYPCSFCPAVWHAACATTYAGLHCTLLQRSDAAGWHCPACMVLGCRRVALPSVREAEREHRARTTSSSTGKGAGVGAMPATAAKVLQTGVDSRCRTIRMLSDSDVDHDAARHPWERYRERCRVMEETVVEQAQRPQAIGQLAETTNARCDDPAVAVFQKRQQQTCDRLQSVGDAKRYKTAVLTDERRFPFEFKTAHSPSFRCEHGERERWRVEAQKTADRAQAPSPPCPHAPAACDAETDVSDKPPSYGERFRTIVHDQLQGRYGVAAAAAAAAAAAGMAETAKQLEHFRTLDDGTCYQVGHASNCTCPICTQNRRRAHKGAKGVKPNGGGGSVGGGIGSAGGMSRPLVVNPPPALNGGTMLVSRTFGAPSAGPAVTAVPPPMAASTARVTTTVGEREVRGGCMSASSSASASVLHDIVPRAPVLKLLAGLHAQSNAYRLTTALHNKARGNASPVAASSLPRYGTEMPRADAATDRQTSPASVSRLPSLGAVRVAAELGTAKEDYTAQLGQAAVTSTATADCLAMCQPAPPSSAPSSSAGMQSPAMESEATIRARCAMSPPRLRTLPPSAAAAVSAPPQQHATAESESESESDIDIG
jgi:hypothetical protein